MQSDELAAKSPLVSSSDQLQKDTIYIYIYTGGGELSKVHASSMHLLLLPSRGEMTKASTKHLVFEDS